MVKCLSGRCSTPDLRNQPPSPKATAPRPVILLPRDAARLALRSGATRAPGTQGTRKAGVRSGKTRGGRPSPLSRDPPGLVPHKGPAQQPRSPACTPEAGMSKPASPQGPTFPGRRPGPRDRLGPTAPRLPLRLSRSASTAGWRGLRGLGRGWRRWRRRRLHLRGGGKRGHATRSRLPGRKRPPRPRLLGPAQRAPQAASASLSLRKRIPPGPRQPGGAPGGWRRRRRQEAPGRDKGVGLGGSGPGRGAGGSEGSAWD